jgi:ferredoxin
MRYDPARGPVGAKSVRNAGASFHALPALSSVEGPGWPATGTAIATRSAAAVKRMARFGAIYFPAVAYIICEPCIGTKDSACVDVCPVDCIHPRKDEPGFESAEMLYIHPDECIDCGACVPACPVEAIFALDETPEKWKQFIPINSQFYQK